MYHKKELTPEFLKAVGDYMLVETPLAVADVCLVFGNAKPDGLAKRAAQLYHQGYCHLIVVSGGVATPGDGRLEAYRMRDVLVAEGVPADKILIEDKATHTGENVIFSMALLDKKMGLANIKSVLAIGHLPAARRFLMTLEKHWPGVIKMFASPHPLQGVKKHWADEQSFRKNVLEEYSKIPDYEARGFIKEIDLDALHQTIAALPKPPRPPAP